MSISSFKDIYSKIRLEDLYVFKVLCEEKSFSKASKILKKTQGTISLELSRLEEIFNTKLIYRTSKSFKITNDGQSFLNFCKKVINDLNDLGENMRMNAEKISGVINISSSSIPGEYIFPQFIKDFKSIHTNIDFKIKISNSRTAIKDLENNSADLALVGLDINLTNNNNFDTLKIGEDILVFICDKNHKLLEKEEIKLLDLYNFPFILREEGSATRKMFELSKYYIEDKIKVNFELDSNQSILSTIKNSNLITILSVYPIGINMNTKIQNKMIINDYAILIPIDYIPIKRKFFLVKKKEEKIDINSPTFIFWNFCLNNLSKFL